MSNTTFVTVISEKGDIVYAIEPDEIVLNGGQGSGNFGHEGRPGKVGGSTDQENGLRSTKLSKPINVYHITYKDNVGSIKEKGLRPTSEVGINPALEGSPLSYDMDGVFLANASQARILFTQFRDLEVEAAILEVYLPKGTTVYEDTIMQEGSLIVESVNRRNIREITYDTLERRRDEFIDLFSGDKVMQSIRIHAILNRTKMALSLPTVLVKQNHLGPGPHPSGSGQEVHGEEGSNVDEFLDRDKALNTDKSLKRLKVPETLYHITERKNLDSILKNGLIAEKKQFTGGMLDRGSYLTSDAQSIIAYSPDINFDDPVILEIKTEGLDLRLDPEYFYYDDISQSSVYEYIDEVNEGIADFAMYSKKSIPASAISFPG